MRADSDYSGGMPYAQSVSQANVGNGQTHDAHRRRPPQSPEAPGDCARYGTRDGVREQQVSSDVSAIGEKTTLYMYNNNNMTTTVHVYMFMT